MATNEKYLPSTDAHEQILEIEERIDEELSKGEQADMHLTNAYFRRIRKLDGGVYEKSEEEVSRELNALYAKAKRRQRRKRVGSFTDSLHSVAQRAASILILIGVFSGLSAVVYAAREPIVNFLSNTYDKYIEIFFDENDVEKAPSKIETVYTLGSVPQGYELCSEYISDTFVEFTWKNKEDGSIKLVQRTLGGISSFDNEELESLHVDVNGMSVLVTEKSIRKAYIWNTNDYLFSIAIYDGDIEMAEGLELVRSITEYQK